MGWTRIDRIGRYLTTDTTLYLWCSGSNGRKDWLRNLDPRAEQVAPGVWVASADIREARTVWREVHSLARNRHVHIVGFSRGAAVAVGLALWIPPDISYTLEVYAPKRAANKKAVLELHHVQAYAQKGDIIPFLPPWLAQTKIEWQCSLTWPWRAHIAMAKHAAKRRHEISRNTKEGKDGT